jgi:asparagine N-glycosylation enzyme membrane subunit Stt3
MSRQRLSTLAILLAVALASWFVRATQHRKVALEDGRGWITTDPDSQYQMRRVERALDEGLPPAGFDERMNAPHGAPIPWPPYYTSALALALGPFAPEEGRRLWIERAVGSSAVVFSVLGTLLAAWAAHRLAGNTAALVAGLSHALCGAAVEYGKVGNGDHHAFVSLLSGAMLFVFSCACDERTLVHRGRSLALGACAGALAGLALGSWVASLMYVVQLELALGVLLSLHARRPRAGVPLFGLAFHGTALLVLWPAIVHSPWIAEQPWIVVNLSWFHAAFLALGALVCAPLAWLAPQSPWTRRWPALALAALLALGLWVTLGDGAPARGVREGFAWVSRADAFMARVGESRPLVGSGTGGALFDALGLHVLLLPAAWIAMLRAARCGDLRWLPWTFALPLMAAQAAHQARFAEALALPMAVALGFAIELWIDALSRAGRGARAIAWMRTLAPVAVVLCSWPTLSKTRTRLQAGANAARFELASRLGARAACEWIGAQPELTAGESVLADWNHGHLIERVAQRASVATNFGSYVGVDGFRAPARLFLSEDFDAADNLLAEHGARYVLVDSDLPNNLNGMLTVLPQSRERYVEPGSERGGDVRPAWFLTLGARLMFDGAVFGPLAPGSRPADRLRCVWIAPFTDPTRQLRRSGEFAPAAWVWERVAGAVVELRGEPGAELRLELDVRFEAVQRTLRWKDRVSLDGAGLARLRVPYATDARNGDGSAAGPARWTLGSRSGLLSIPESAVRAGTVLRVP